MEGRDTEVRMTVTEREKKRERLGGLAQIQTDTVFNFTDRAVQTWSSAIEPSFKKTD